MPALTSKMLKVGVEYTGRYHRSTAREIVELRDGMVYYFERDGHSPTLERSCAVYQFLLWAGDVKEA